MLLRRSAPRIFRALIKLRHEAVNLCDLVIFSDIYFEVLKRDVISKIRALLPWEEFDLGQFRDVKAPDPGSSTALSRELVHCLIG